MTFFEFDKLKADPKASVETALASEAEQAAKSIANGESPRWPAQISCSANEAQEGVHAKAVRELFAMAAAWAILHEMQHAKFYDDPEQAVMIALPRKCSVMLTRQIFSLRRSTNTPSSRQQLQIAYVESEQWLRSWDSTMLPKYLARAKLVGTHLPLRDRIKLLFDKVGTESAAHFWGFATAMMWGLEARDCHHGGSIGESFEPGFGIFRFG